MCRQWRPTNGVGKVACYKKKLSGPDPFVTEGHVFISRLSCLFTEPKAKAQRTPGRNNSNLMKMLIESYLCPPRAGCPFHTTAKRYWLPDSFSAHSLDSDALTLLLLHSTSFHKETWEPTLSHIFECAARPGSRVKLREAWLVDCPNHGEAAVHNERVLRQDEHAEVFTCQKYAQAVHSFLTAGINEGARVDFASRRLVGIGHSLGANTILLLQQYEPRLPFLSLVIIEPMVSPGGPEPLKKLEEKLISDAYRRRDVWPSREEARSHFEVGWKDYDEKVIHLFVDYGLRRHPGAKWSDAPFNGVTLACSREQEAAMYRDREGITKPVEALIEISRSIPVHLILGGLIDAVPLEARDALLNLRTDQCYASIRYIDNVGHLIPQKKPEQLGSVVFATLPQRSLL